MHHVDIVDNLKFVEDKYEGKVYATGEFCVGDMARDCRIEILRLRGELAKYKNSDQI